MELQHLSQKRIMSMIRTEEYVGISGKACSRTTRKDMPLGRRCTLWGNRSSGALGCHIDRRRTRLCQQAVLLRLDLVLFSVSGSCIRAYNFNPLPHEEPSINSNTLDLGSYPDDRDISRSMMRMMVVRLIGLRMQQSRPEGPCLTQHLWA